MLGSGKKIDRTGPAALTPLARLFLMATHKAVIPCCAVFVNAHLSLNKLRFPKRRSPFADGLMLVFQSPVELWVGY
jgi:hypothetical protein